MFVGGKVVEAIELEARQVDLEARLLESENLVHHFQSVIRNRDQELNSTKRVSTHKDTHSHCKKKKKPKRTNDYEYLREIVFNLSYSFFFL